MTSGKGTGFEGAQRDFLKNLIPAFLAKTAYREAAAIGKALPEDDPDLSKWVNERRNDFEAKFSADIINNPNSSLAKTRESFDAFFRNTKSKAKSKWEAAAAKEFQRIIVQGLASQDPSSPPVPLAQFSAKSTDPSKKPTLDINALWSELLKGSNITGRKLFDNEHRPAISQEIHDIRKRDSIPRKMHIGMLNSVLKARWNGLQDTQRMDWENRAADLKASDEANLIYRNQALICEQISLLLSSLIGPVEAGHNKIGNARFHVLWAFRDAEEALRTGRLDITGQGISESVDYSTFNKDYTPNVMEPWRNCCLKTVERNTPIQEIKPYSIIFDEDLRPLLPELDIDNITSEALRTILSEFLQEHWSWCRSTALLNASSIPQEIPWADEKFHSYLSSSFHSLRNPALLKPHALFELLDHVTSEIVESRHNVFCFDAEHSSELAHSLIPAQVTQSTASRSSILNLPSESPAPLPLPTCKYTPISSELEQVKSTPLMESTTSLSPLPATSEPLNSVPPIVSPSDEPLVLPQLVRLDTSELLKVAGTAQPDNSEPLQSAPIVPIQSASLLPSIATPPHAPSHSVPSPSDHHSQPSLPGSDSLVQTPLTASGGSGSRGTKRIQIDTVSEEGAGKEPKKKKQRTFDPALRRSSGRVATLKERAAIPLVTDKPVIAESEPEIVVLDSRGRPRPKSKFWTYQ